MSCLFKMCVVMSFHDLLSFNLWELPKFVGKGSGVALNCFL